MEQTNYPKFRCKVCKTIVQSKYSGHFSTCKCPYHKMIAVDYTDYYGRHIGNPEQFEEVKDGD